MELITRGCITDRRNIVLAMILLDLLFDIDLR
jgi:hypothetical protein